MKYRRPRNNFFAQALFLTTLMRCGGTWTLVYGSGPGCSGFTFHVPLKVAEPITAVQGGLTVGLSFTRLCSDSVGSWLDIQRLVRERPDVESWSLFTSYVTMYISEF